MKNQVTTPKVFLTDYASYNNGTQFEFGHWVELNQFNDVKELNQYISEHFKECDKKSPLDYPREEIMLTDYEDFPSELYSESFDIESFEAVFFWMNLDEWDKIKFEFYLWNGSGVEYATDNYENISYIEDTTDALYEFAEEMFPNLNDIERSNDYISFNYDRYKENEFTQFEAMDGESYLICDYSI